MNKYTRIGVADAKGNGHQSGEPLLDGTGNPRHHQHEIFMR